MIKSDIIKILNQVIKESGLIPHPKFEGRFIIPDRPNSISKYTIKELSSRKLMSVNEDKTKEGYRKFYETLTHCYVMENCISDDNEYVPKEAGFVYGKLLALNSKGIVVNCEENYDVN